MKGMKKHMKHLISLPVFKNVMKTKYPTQMGKLSLPNMPLHVLETPLTSVSNQKTETKEKAAAAVLKMIVVSIRMFEIEFI